jgi:hypothetical protein
MGNTLIAGILAGAALALVLAIYMLFRGKALVTFFKNLDESMARMPDRVIFGVLIAGFVGAAFVFGALAGLVYGWVGSRDAFLGIGLGLAALFSLLAAISRTPLIVDKIVWNFAVGGVLGVLTPWFASF